MPKAGKMDNAPTPLRVSVLEHYPEYARAIGMINVEISILERALGEFLAALLHVERHYGIVIYLTPHANLARLQILENVMHDTVLENSGGRKACQALIDRARAVIGKRHEYTHNLWGLSITNPQNVISRRQMPPKENKPAVPVSINELSDLITKIRVLIDEVTQATESAFSEWPPYTWRGKLPPPPDEDQIPENHLPTSDPLKP